MINRNLIYIMGVFLIFSILGLVGCSDNKFSTTVSSVTPNASPKTYIPVTSGWRVSYAQLEPERVSYYVEITDPVVIDGHQGVTVRRTNNETGQNTYSYIYATATAIYESSSLSSPGQKILESPFTAGHSWDRYESSVAFDDEPAGDTTDSGGDIIDGANKTVPGEEYGRMFIVGFESVPALDGHLYANCLKVAWQSEEYSYNYYWYAAGIGLVKFESVPNSLSAWENTSVTVMTDFGQIEY
ncbi:MAG: hypothetical protein KAR42_16395 [candidate division Zixibacteria bacterium]|nr:hypothetical protein [candidate division Zixibacteria bacterium]